MRRSNGPPWIGTTKSHGPFGQCGLVPIRPSNRALVTFDYRLLSNSY